MQQPSYVWVSLQKVHLVHFILSISTLFLWEPMRYGDKEKWSVITFYWLGPLVRTLTPVTGVTRTKSDIQCIDNLGS